MNQPTILPATPARESPTNGSPSPNPDPARGDRESGFSEPAQHVLDAPFLDPAPESEWDGDDAGASDGTSPARLTPQQFRDSFAAIFNLSSRATGLRSLAIGEDRRAEADAAADAIYETALEVPWLSWLIEPGNVWVQRAFVVGAFGYGTARGVSAELAERQAAARAKNVTPDQPANDNDPPARQAGDLAPVGETDGAELTR